MSHASGRARQRTDAARIERARGRRPTSGPRGGRRRRGAQGTGGALARRPAPPTPRPRARGARGRQRRPADRGAAPATAAPGTALPKRPAPEESIRRRESCTCYQSATCKIIADDDKVFIIWIVHIIFDVNSHFFFFLYKESYEYLYFYN